MKDPRQVFQIQGGPLKGAVFKIDTRRESVTLTNSSFGTYGKFPVLEGSFIRAVYKRSQAPDGSTVYLYDPGE